MNKILMPGKVILAKLYLLFFLNTSYAQEKFSVHASQVQLEVLGPAGEFSFNFDSRFGKKGNGIGFRIGFGVASWSLAGESCNSGGSLNIPAGINYLVGKNRHLLELGGGGTLLVFSSGTKMACPGFEYDFFSEKTKPYIWLLTGYRFQPIKKKGLIFRCFISPLYQKDFPVKFWGGASVGYRF